MKIESKNITSFIWQFLSLQKFSFLALVILHLAWSVDQTVMPYIFKIFIDRVANFTGIRSEVWSVIALPVILGASLWIITDVMFRTWDFMACFIFPKFEANIRMNMYKYVQSHSYNFFSENFAGSLASKISDMPNSATAAMELIIVYFIPTSVALIIGTSIFTSLHPDFAIILCSWYFLHFGLCFKYARKCNQLSNIHSESKVKLNGKIVDSFSNILSIKSFSKVKYELTNLWDSQKDEQDKHKKMKIFLAKIRLIHGIMCFSFMGVLMNYFMITKWQAGLLTTGELTYVFYTSWGLTVMAWIAGSMLPNFFREIGVCSQALTIIKAEHEVKDKKNARKLKAKKGEIEFKNVSFGYNQENPVFDKKNLKIEPGTKVGLVGESGSGKTTFVNLLLRFFDVTSGEIKIDGQNIADVTRDSLRENIAMIPQDTSLFHRTLLENIRYGNTKATKADVVKASKKAFAHDFIEKLDEKYETLVGERGVKLSGGQRQRIAIARAILKNAPILILDEATSALDSVTEKHIQESLKSLMQKRTTIVIAHRLSTLKEMDRILVMAKGKIIEDGTHKSLLAKKGHYYKLWSMQSNGFI